MTDTKAKKVGNKLKCRVCKKEFEPQKEHRYTGVAVRMTGPNDYYDCFDCPNCGSQIIVNKRIQKAEK